MNIFSERKKVHSYHFFGGFDSFKVAPVQNILRRFSTSLDTYFKFKYMLFPLNGNVFLYISLLVAESQSFGLAQAWGKLVEWYKHDNLYCIYSPPYEN